MMEHHFISSADVALKLVFNFFFDKINGNKANDEKAAKALKKDGWKVITVWECKLKPAKADKTLLKLLSELNKCLF